MGSVQVREMEFKVKIITKYVGPTDTKGARLVAKCAGRQLSMPYRYELSVTQNHSTIAARLASKLKLSGVFVAESRETGYAFSQSDSGFEAFRVGTAGHEVF